MLGLFSILVLLHLLLLLWIAYLLLASAIRKKLHKMTMYYLNFLENRIQRIMAQMLGPFKVSAHPSLTIFQVGTSRRKTNVSEDTSSLFPLYSFFIIKAAIKSHRLPMVHHNLTNATLEENNEILCSHRELAHEV
jgi:hypothetical protein